MKLLPVHFRKKMVLALLMLVPVISSGQLRPPPSKIVKHPENVTECEGFVTVGYRIVMERSTYGYLYQWQMAPYKSTFFRPVGEVLKGIVDDSKATLVLPFDKVTGLGKLTQKDWDRMQFRCVVQEDIKLAEPETSDVAFLFVKTPPSIYKHPSSADKIVNESVSFSISASGSLPRNYQWQYNGGSGYSNIPGATSTVHTIGSLTVDDAGIYRCVVTNPCGIRTSNGATLTVEQPIYDDGWFSQTSNTSKDIYQVSFTSTLNGWAVVYDPDKILHTIDGGESWSVTSTGLGGGVYRWYSVKFLDTNNGFLGGSSSSIARTENGGSSWTRYSIHDSLDLGVYWPYIYDFHFIDENTGWAVGDYALIIKTTDGGDTWVKQNFNGSPTAGMDGYLRTVWFNDSQNGWVAGENGKIYQSEDGGLNWTEQTTPNTINLQDITFLDANNGFAAGYGYRNLLVTTNGGTNWNLIPTSNMPSMIPYAIEFTSSSDGWIAGYRYEGSAKADILRTNDGGSTWHRQFLEEGGDILRHLDMVDAENGWAVGNTGTILRTATGGCLLPTVNLYGDEALCASESYTMVADTFNQNLNCSYLWNTGATTGSLTVYGSDIYSVIVTSLCGETAEDSKNLEFYPLPSADAGVDTFLCYGDTIQLNASGGQLFSWSPGSTLSDPGIQNPNAFPTSSTQYFVSVTDSNGCVNSDNVYLTVYPIPTSTFTAPAFVCGTAEAAINYTGSASEGTGLFYWDFDGGTNTPSGLTNNVSWTEIGLKTVSLVVSENSCVSDTTWKEISVNPVPVSAFTLPAAVCGSDEADIVYDGSDSLGADYTWSFDGGVVSSGTDEGPYKVSWSAEGTKTVSLQVNQEGCISETTSKQIIVSYPYEGQGICLVSLDQDTRKNAIIWEKSDSTGVQFYRIYRQSPTGETYELLETLPVDTLSYYIDMTSEPESKSHRYKIAVFDTCGNESDLSLFHKTMLLSTNLGTTTINLSWTEYVVEDKVGLDEFKFEYVIIKRGPSPNELDSITTYPSNNTTWIDTDPPAGDVFYQVVGVVADPCSPSGRYKAGTGPYNHSLSNMDDNKLKTSVKDMISGVTNLRVFPNPFSEKLNVEYNLEKTSDVKIEVYNLLGVRILEVENTRQTPGAHNYNIRSEELDGSSIYYLRFSVDNNSSVIKLIPAY